MTYQKRFKYLLLLFLVASTSVIKAGIEPVLRNTLSGSGLYVSNSFQVEDAEYAASNLGSYQLYKCDNFINLEINQDQIASCFLDTFWFEVEVEVTGWDANGVSSQETFKLDVVYDQQLGKKYKAIDTRKLKDYYKIEVEILSISDVTLVDFITLSGEIAIERYKTLNVTQTPSITSVTQNSSTGFIEVEWPSISGAEEYDLEWTYIDDYEIGSGNYLTSSSVEVHFKHNSTRVTVTGNKYLVSNNFDHGYVVFRLRGVGRAGYNFTHRINGRWSNYGVGLTVDQYNSNHYTAVTASEPTLNWQYVSAFAEQGKNKDVISYMDGSMRERQAVTRVSSDTTVIVGETVYDYQGRPALSVLPAPIYEAKIEYYPDLNLDSITGLPYSREHFDKGTCTLMDAHAMKTAGTVGASNYYSSSNSFLSVNGHKLQEHNPYLPDAQKKPFVRTQYTPDPTGRIARQGGVGPDHQIGSGHETKNYYGTPYQEELDRLFGNDVGRSDHYQKQMTVDPNGQVSITYTDLAGNVIATALAGDAPQDQSPLESNTGNKELEVEITSDILTKQADDYSLSSTKVINVAVQGEYRISYLLSLDNYTEECLSECYECVYDVKLSLIDECGDELLDGDNNTAGLQTFSRELKNSSGSGYSLTCDAPGLYRLDQDALLNDSIRVTLPVGSYTLTKTLTVSKKAAEHYADLYIANNSCTKTLEDFETYYESTIDNFGCDITCETCSTELADSNFYISNRRAYYVGLGYPDGNDLLYKVREEYYARKAVCDQICQYWISPCEKLKLALEVDVAPGGQYQHLNGDITQHPEYCEYEFCTNNRMVFTHDEFLDSITNGTWALENGLFDPLQNQSGLYPTGIYDTFFVDHTNPNFVNYLANELNKVMTAPDQSAQVQDVDIWQASIYITYYAETYDPLKSNYENIEAAYQNFDFNTRSCEIKDHYLWETFRALYKVARQRALEHVKSDLGCSPSIDQGYEKRFKNPDEVAADNPSTPTGLNNEFIATCEQSCDSMANAWIEILRDECLSTLDPSEIDQIKADFIAVCKGACDGDHPMGATDNPYMAATFKSIIEDHDPEIHLSGKCDALLITTPGSFDNPTKFQFDSTEWFCVCPSEWEPCLIYDSDPDYRYVIQSLYFESQKYNCDTFCYECIDVHEAFSKFWIEHGSDFDLTTPGKRWPEIFTAYMNRELKIIYSFEQYMEFFAGCAGLEEGYDETETQIIDAYKARYGDPTEWQGYQDYIEDIENGLVQNDWVIPDHQYSPDALYASADNNIMDWNIYNSPVVPTQESVLSITTTDCNDYALLNSCVCSYLFQSIQNNDPEAGQFETCVGSTDFELIKKACLNSFMSEDGDDIDNITSSGSWNQQAKWNLEAAALANNLYFPLSCFSIWDCADCDPNNTVTDFGPLDHKGDPQPTPSVKPDPIPYTPPLNCQTITNSLLDYIDANKSWMSIPMTQDHIDEVMEYVDSLYSGAPYFRKETKNDPNDDVPYRRRRFMAELARCRNTNFSCSGNRSDEIEKYFGCTESCIRPTKFNWQIQNWLRDLTYLQTKEISSGPLVGTETRYNLLFMNGWGKVTEGVTSYYQSDLYEGTNQSSLVYTRDPQVQRPFGPGEASFKITDGTETTNLYVAFFSPDKKICHFNAIRGVYGLKQVYTAPCSGSKQFYFTAIIEDLQKNIYHIPMFGWTDQYETVEECEVAPPKICSAKEDLLFEVQPCDYVLKQVAKSYAKFAYNQYIDSVRNQFIHNYSKACIEKAIGSERLKLRFVENDYHFTLYYRDLAGNLIQTVPPKGVDVLDATEIAQSMSYRDGSGSPIYPSHTYKSQYQYNTLNELKWQQTPDGGQSRFWYDRLGRLVVSQNAKQEAINAPTYSYTLYDDLGRIKEVGQLEKILGQEITESIVFDDNLLSSWVSTATGKEQITRTYYDNTQYTVNYGDFSQDYLRNRVSSMTYTAIDGATNPNHLTHYSYDVHGNVKSMVREIPHLDSIYQRYKLIEYSYELVSGNMIEVAYQKDSIDRFYHKYLYDDDNRIRSVYTSTDRIHWDRDANYKYYLHGSLARMELGQLNVQGMDYAYTIHGWLKGVNSERLLPDHDIGRDGASGANNEWFCKDEFGFGLGYYSGEYNSIVTPTNNFIINKTGSDLQDSAFSLYNGNISSMVTAIGKLMYGANNDIPFGRAFQYDQLNRIKRSVAFKNVNTTSNAWFNNGSSWDAYRTNYSYDANGNITSLYRRGPDGKLDMDNFTYNYQSGTNKLEYVDDAITSSLHGVDIDDQSSGNYTYDQIGNLISDASEEIQEIKWTVYGKVSAIIRTPGSEKPELQFEYSPDGYRVAKHVIDKDGFTTSTWYIRDASGNIMATYNKTEYAGLDTTQFDATALNDILVNDWGAGVFGRFLWEGLSLHTEMDPAQFTYLKNQLNTALQLETAMRSLSPMYILPTDFTLMNNVYNLYTDVELYNIFLGFYGDDVNLANSLYVGCNSDFVQVEIIENNFMAFTEYLFGIDVSIRNYFWNNYGTGYPGYPTYPGDAAFVAYLSGSYPLSVLSSEIMIQYGSYDLVHEYSMSGVGLPLSVVIQNYYGFRTCPEIVLGGMDQVMNLLDLYDRSLLWDRIGNSTSWDAVANAMILNAPNFFLEAAIRHLPTVVGGGVIPDYNVIFINLPNTYHVTDYLNKIKEYGPFGMSYYNSVVNQLMNMGYVADGWHYSAEEHHLYGSSRVGVHKTELTLRNRFASGDIAIGLEEDGYTEFYRGKRHYELSNHLGNVQVVLTDKRVSVCDQELGIERFEAEVISAMDYYPFGMLMPDRQWYAQDDSSYYRFGFNGMEKDDDVKGVGNNLDFGARIYDSRLGRFLTIDKLFYNYPTISPYSFSSNCPIAATDINGDSIYFINSNPLVYYLVDKILKSGNFPEVEQLANSQTTHVYLGSQNFNIPGSGGSGNNAGAVTWPNAFNNQLPIVNNKLVIPNVKDQRFRVFNNLPIMVNWKQRNDAGVMVPYFSTSNSLIALNERWFNHKYFFYDPQGLSEYLLHELYAHVIYNQKNGDAGKQDHDFYGAERSTMITTDLNGVFFSPETPRSGSLAQYVHITLNQMNFENLEVGMSYASKGDYNGIQTYQEIDDSIKTNLIRTTGHPGGGMFLLELLKVTEIDIDDGAP